MLNSAMEASEYLMSHLAGLFLSREKIIDETVGDAVIGSVIGTLISTRNASREPSEYVEPGDYVTNRRFFSLFNDKNNDLQRILCAGSEGVLEGKEFADKLECFTFAIFETLQRFDTSRKEWSQVSTQKLRAAIDHLGILGSDDIANQDRHSELIVTQALNLDRLRKSLGPVDQSHVKDRLRYFGVETFFLARDMFFLGHVSKGRLYPPEPRHGFLAKLTCRRLPGGFEEGAETHWARELAAGILPVCVL
jgi:hypothetical protein